MKLFELPRTVGYIDGNPVLAMKGRFGPYLKLGDKTVSIPKGKDPLTITLDECRKLLSGTVGNGNVLREFKEAGIEVIDGRYGPYIKADGKNYRLPRGTNIATLTEARCKEIIANPSGAKKASYRRSFKK